MSKMQQRHTEMVAALCRRIEASEETPRLDDLARAAGVSVFHLHRVFKATTGLTPRAYAAAHRSRRVRASLEARASITEAIHDAGYASSSRFYENDLLGMTPTQFKRGGDGMEIRFAIGLCSLGSILVAATQRGVCAISMGDEPEELLHELERRFPKARLVGADADFEGLVAKVVGLVEAPNVGVDLPLDIRGTAFQQRVWRALRAIPPGSTATYAEIARAIGTPSSTRAVAGACAANPVAVAIPCHRVVRTDGGISGYRWGVERKRALLDRESGSPSIVPRKRAPRSR